MKIQINEYPSAEEFNELYANGYKYTVWGDSHISHVLDPWSGMPSEDHNLYAFTDKKEAEAYAQTQTYCFNKDIHPDVKIIPEHTETNEEYWERVNKEKAERKAKREAKEAQKAKDAGMTVAEYRKAKAHSAQVKRVKNEIHRLEMELASLKADLATLEKQN
jgi:hypothetical protein